MYKTVTIEVDQYNLVEYSKNLSILSNNLYNRINYIKRQLFTGLNKDIKTPNEQEVIDLVNKYLKKWNKNKKATYKKKHCNKKGFKPLVFDKDNRLIDYYYLDYILKESNDVDYRSLPIHTAQRVIKQVCEAWDSYFKSLKEYKNNPSKFIGRPKLPKYHKKGGYNIVRISNISSKIENGNLKLPGTKDVLNISDIYKDLKFIKLEIKIDLKVKLYITFEENKDIINLNDNNRYLGIDLGVDNFATLTNNIGLNPILIKGKDLKSYNQYINKRIAYLTSILKTVNKKYTSNQIKRLWDKRYKYFYNVFHRLNNNIIKYLKENDINTVIIGKNDNWKQEVNINKSNNQNFCYIPYNMFINNLKYKCELNGINCIVREESYTSKASVLDNDIIPTYSKSNNKTYNFSGKRINRGLYKTKEGILINADVNGSCNIIRKEFKDAFKTIDTKYLLNPKTINVNQMLPCASMA